MTLQRQPCGCMGFHLSLAYHMCNFRIDTHTCPPPLEQQLCIHFSRLSVTLWMISQEVTLIQYSITLMLLNASSMSSIPRFVSISFLSQHFCLYHENRPPSNLRISIIASIMSTPVLCQAGRLALFIDSTPDDADKLYMHTLLPIAHLAAAY